MSVLMVWMSWLYERYRLRMNKSFFSSPVFFKTKLEILFMVMAVTSIHIAHGQSLRRIEIEIEQDSIDALESHPYSNEDVRGNFISDDERFNAIDIHYRGAFYLYTLIQSKKQRNWKIKVPKQSLYLNRREWNYNFEQHIRQKLAYLLMEKAGVKVVSTEHVMLYVNNQKHGLYLQYEDPDNKKWLKDAFGSSKGDLYKAAYDMPNQTKYFGDLTVLGSADADYFLHYRKQTNDEGEMALDYTTLINFIKIINNTSDLLFEETISRYFDVDEFLNYLVVSNFISNWDGYPQRPKNYWLYLNPEDGKWHYIPWDLDGTFQKEGFLNEMGTDASVLYYMDHYEPYSRVDNETKERPLVWRIMQVESFRNRYLQKYQRAISTFLDRYEVFADIDSIAAVVQQNSSGEDWTKFQQSVIETKSFINAKNAKVKPELNKWDFTSQTSLHHSMDILVFPNPARNYVTVQNLNTGTQLKAYELLDQAGRVILEDMHLPVGDSELSINLSDVAKGFYILNLILDHGSVTKTIILE